MDDVGNNPRRVLSPFDLCLRRARLTHFGLIAAAFVQLYVLFMVVRMIDPKPATEHRLGYGIFAFAITNMLILLLARDFLISNANTGFKRDRNDVVACRLWKGAQLLTSAGCYSLFVFGWVLAFLREAGWTYAALWLLCAAGFVAFVPHSRTTDIP